MQERWLKLQDLILRLKSKHALTARCLSLTGLLTSTEKMVPKGRLHMRPFQFHLKEHWRYRELLDNLLPWSETISAHLEWWQILQCDEGCGPSPQRPQYPNLYRHLKQRLGCSLRASLYIKPVVRQGVKATHKYSRVEGGISGPEKVQRPVSKSNSVGSYGQLKSSSLHKQTGRNPLSGDVCSPVENHDLVPSLPDNSKS